MGVPSFYAWLVKKYPQIKVRAAENREQDVDTTQPNPNGEFHNLYLDMNGIIHPCFHPEDEIFPPTTFEEVFQRIFMYIDRIFAIIRPQKLLFMAIDGVAPRAKINQQRSRRFRAAKDSETADAEEKRLREQFEKEGKFLLPEKESEVRDSNIITPGTAFMYQLSNALQSYIKERLKNNAGWMKIKVILSDANVPGEGEHKIMSFIRAQRSFSAYNPNTRHCLYGLDADLIMLSLATHEVHFSILREDVLVEVQSKVTSTGGTTICQKPYELRNLWTLRDYLELNMKILDLPERCPNFDIERVIDDFIFLCLFVGNDFLPHMPSLEIHERAIDLLMACYSKEFSNLGGYIVDMQKAREKKGVYIKMKRVERLIAVVGSYEQQIFNKRRELHEYRRKKLMAQNEAAPNDEHYDVNMDMDGTLGAEIAQTINGFQNFSRNSFGHELQTLQDDQILISNTKELKEKVRATISRKCDMWQSGDVGLDKDEVKFGSEGWKERYYMHKLCAKTHKDIEIIRKEIVEKYIEGLCWVHLYYFSGVPSWTWYYPYNYGPCASDIKNVGQLTIRFEEGSPFKPLDQLMAVLPPRSAHALPKAFQVLMSSEDSSIRDFYPEDFDVDTGGKRYQWQGICKLPFIDEKRLLCETIKLEKELVGDEVIRNSTRHDILFVSTSSNNLGKDILSLHKDKVCQNEQDLKIDMNLSDGMSGFVNLSHEETDGSPICNVGDRDGVIFVKYKPPTIVTWRGPKILKGVVMPEKQIVNESEIERKQLWHEEPIKRHSASGKIHGPSGVGRGGYGGSNDRCNMAFEEQCRVSEYSERGGRFGWNNGRGRADLSFPEHRRGGRGFISVEQQRFGSYRGAAVGPYNYEMRAEASPRSFLGRGVSRGVHPQRGNPQARVPMPMARGAVKWVEVQRHERPTAAHLPGNGPAYNTSLPVGIAPAMPAPLPRGWRHDGENRFGWRQGPQPPATTPFAVLLHGRSPIPHPGRAGHPRSSWAHVVRSNNEANHAPQWQHQQFGPYRN